MKSKTYTDPSANCDCHRYLREAIGLFKNDPTDSDFQLGYLAALVTMRDDLTAMRHTRAARAHHAAQLAC
jgi:hypothetical protein